MAKGQIDVAMSRGSCIGIVRVGLEMVKVLYVSNFILIKQVDHK